MTPFRRHQVFEIPELPMDITEYRLFSADCTCCDNQVKATLPPDAPSGQMGPRLMGTISVLAGQYHLSVRKIKQLLSDQYGTTFSVGAISEAQGRVSSMLTPLHQALKKHIHKDTVIHADETTHQRNGEDHTRWCWLMAGSDAVYQHIRYFRNQDNAKLLLGEQGYSVVVTDQCASYNWLDADRHQFCLAHVQRNLQQMADYSGGGLTAHIGAELVLLFKSIFRTHHRYERGELSGSIWHRRLNRLRRSISQKLEMGSRLSLSKKYAGRCAHILKYEKGLWVFMKYKGVPLTNNEAERCIRGSVIMRKICYGTSSDRGEKFRSRLLSVIETCKKRSLSPLNVISTIVGAVTAKTEYPDVFDLSLENSS